MPTSASGSLEGLFLTWQRDPASTMTLQWLEQGEPLPLEPLNRHVATPAVSFEIPNLDASASLDEALWNRGFAIELMTDHGERFDDFLATGRLAWTEQGVVLGVEVRQSVFLEAAEVKELWRGDSVELLLGKDGERVWHGVATPGLDPRHPVPRLLQLVPEAECAATAPKVRRTADGYRLWMTVPWEALGADPLTRCHLLDVQIYVNQRHSPLHKRRIAWCPYWKGLGDKEPFYTVSLSQKASPPFEMMAEAARKPEATGALCTVISLPVYDGLPVELRRNGKLLGQGCLSVEQGSLVSRAEIAFDGPPAGDRWDAVELWFAGKHQFNVSLELTSADVYAVEGAELHYRKQGEVEVLTKQAEVVPLQCLPGYFLHRVELTGLEADTVYHFGVGDRFERSGEGYSFRTMPRELHRPVTMAIGGDTLHQQEWMEATARAVLRYELDFVVFGGDLADTNGETFSRGLWHEWFGALRSALITPQGRVVPVVVAVGNHDVKKGYYYQHPGYVPTDAWRRRLAPEFYELFAFPGQPGYGVLDFGNYASLLILDSDHTNPIAGEQAQWLEETLEQRCDIPHLLPVYHVGAYPSVKSFEGRTERKVREMWAPLFERYGVRVAFEHHNHAYKRTHPIRSGQRAGQGVTYIGDGAWGVATREPYAVEDTWYLAHSLNTRYAVLLTLEGHLQTLKVVDPQGEVVDAVSLPRHEQKEEAL